MRERERERESRGRRVLFLAKELFEDYLTEFVSLGFRLMIDEKE
jgi:hypothetical protein